MIPLSSSGTKFFVGINLGWFSDKYGYDIGHSEFSDAPLWTSPSSAPITANLAVPNIPQDKPYITQHPDVIDQYFVKVNGVDIVRLWLFEQLEGLVFTKDDKNNLSGLDPEFLANLISVLDIASRYNIKVYLTLFNSWDTSSSPPQGLDPSRISKYQELFQARKQLLLNIMQNPTDFCNKIITPLATAITNKPAVFAIDIMNEPESITDANMLSVPQLKSFVDTVTQAISPYGIKVSVGCMRKSMAISLSSGTMDFADHHAYNDPAVPNSQAQLDLYNISDFTSKSCIIGECGYHPSSSPYDTTQETVILQNYLQSANTLGYAGAIAWRYQDYKNPDGVLQTVLGFASTNPTIQSTGTKPRKKGCFIATAALDSEMHPHVQLLREYRDNVLLKSSHKKQFENILEWYYKFSPPVADAMNRDKNLKRVIKYTVVYPIVLSLKILVKLVGTKLE